MIFENSKTYDIIKWWASPGCPALAALLITIGEILNANGVGGNVSLWLGIAGAIVAAIGTCLGEIARQSSKKYWASQQTGGSVIPEYDTEKDPSGIFEE